VIYAKNCTVGSLDVDDGVPGRECGQTGESGIGTYGRKIEAGGKEHFEPDDANPRKTNVLSGCRKRGVDKASAGSERIKKKRPRNRRRLVNPGSPKNINSSGVMGAAKEGITEKTREGELQIDSLGISHFAQLRGDHNAGWSATEGV